MKRKWCNKILFTLRYRYSFRILSSLRFHIKLRISIREVSPLLFPKSHRKWHYFLRLFSFVILKFLAPIGDIFFSLSTIKLIILNLSLLNLLFLDHLLLFLNYLLLLFSLFNFSALGIDFWLEIIAFLQEFFFLFLFEASYFDRAILRGWGASNRRPSMYLCLLCLELRLEGDVSHFELIALFIKLLFE